MAMYFIAGRYLLDVCNINNYPSIQMKAEITAMWCELYSLGIQGLLKRDIVLIMEWDHYESREHGACALAVDQAEQREWIIPVKFLKIIE